MNPNQLQQLDPIKKQAEVSATDRGTQYSPLSPPDALTPPSNVKVPYDGLHPYLKLLVDDHNKLKSEMDIFQRVLQELSHNQDVLGKNAKVIDRFFDVFTTEFILHNQQEEKILFPPLAKRFLEIGEHSKSSKPVTPIDILRNEHIEAMQMGAEARCTWKLIQQIIDPSSQTILLGNFLRRSHTLLEMMRLHIFREDDIVFSLAQKHLTPGQLEEMLESSK